MATHVLNIMEVKDINDIFDPQLVIFNTLVKDINTDHVGLIHDAFKQAINKSDVAKEGRVWYVSIDNKKTKKHDYQYLVLGVGNHCSILALNKAPSFYVDVSFVPRLGGPRPGGMYRSD